MVALVTQASEAGRTTRGGARRGWERGQGRPVDEDSRVKHRNSRCQKFYSMMHLEGGQEPGGALRGL